MEEGRFVEWLKHDGDAVVMGDLLYSVESDKSVNEVEATDDGILRIAATAPAPDTVIPVGALLGYITEPGEALPGAEAVDEGLLAAGSQPLITNNPQPAASHQQPPVAIRQQPTASAPTISPRAKRVAAELNVDWQSLQGSGRTGRIVERDVRAAVSTAVPTVVDASPVARRMAEEAGVDLVALSASLGGKRIDRADVEAAVAVAAAKAKQKPVAVPTPPTPQTPSTPVASRQPPVASPPLPSATATRAKASAVRRITAERMLQSAQNTAPVTLFSEVDATQLVKLRNQLKASQTAFAVPSYTDLLAKICAFALQEHPTVNARFEGDEIVTEAAIHIGIAADTPRGLLVPVLRDVQAKTLRQIATESAALIARAREGKARVDELQGSTFTITNLGMFDIDSFTPIINLPECAILGMGRIVPKQIVVNVARRKVAIRHMMQLSLTFDHRLVDGAPAARFLQRVQQLIQQPYVWLVS